MTGKMDGTSSSRKILIVIDSKRTEKFFKLPGRSVSRSRLLKNVMQVKGPLNSALQEEQPIQTFDV
jgi:hypothetical protein